MDSPREELLPRTLYLYSLPSKPGMEQDTVWILNCLNTSGETGSFAALCELEFHGRNCVFPCCPCFSSLKGPTLLDHRARIKCPLCSNPAPRIWASPALDPQTGTRSRAHLSQKDIQMEIMCVGAGHSEHKSTSVHFESLLMRIPVRPGIW
jgi:hypothetical protein